MRKIKVAISGGIGSGKSVALYSLQILGYPTFSCDEIYKEVISSSEYIQKIKKLFPKAVMHDTIDRKILSQIVFNDSKKLEELNNVAHPLIMQTLLQRMDDCNAKIVFAEVPLLFEGNFENLFDRVIYIERDFHARLQNICLRDNLSKEEALKRIEAQFNPHDEKGRQRLKECNAYIIKNNKSVDELEKELEKIISKF